jgi:serine/threonine protein kinase
MHRDLKPDNIGFDIRGDIKIFDFGLAREFPEHEASEDGTYNFSLAGSLRYMAPEVFLGQPYNGAVDVYSFCIIFWQMLTLARPYDCLCDEEQFAKAVFDNGKRPPTKAGIRKTCKAILERGWCHNAKDRLDISTINGMLRKEVIALRKGDDSGLNQVRRRSTFVFQGK